ncbi:MAG: S1 RNA-binding domain-containing protein [Eubacteriales bacterium]
MQIEVGAILEGKITSITSFGAFVALPEGKTGMIHISEVSSSYVKDIHDFLKEGQSVSVKVISVDASSPNPKIGLSVKQLETDTAQKPRNDSHREPRRDTGRPRSYQNRAQSSPAPQVGNSNPPDYYPSAARQKNTGDAFEDMMNRFKTTSDEKISDLRKNTDAKRSNPGFSRRGKD